jgi:hypothetical protein
MELAAGVWRVTELENIQKQLALVADRITAKQTELQVAVDHWDDWRAGRLRTEIGFAKTVVDCSQRPQATVNDGQPNIDAFVCDLFRVELLAFEVNYARGARRIK